MNTKIRAKRKTIMKKIKGKMRVKGKKKIKEIRATRKKTKIRKIRRRTNKGVE